MSKALSSKDTIDEPVAAAATPPQTPEEFAETNRTKAWRDNVTGAVYADPSACVNGCTQLVGEAAVKGLKEGTAPAPARNEPISAEEQERTELKRKADQRKADEDAAAAAAADAKADTTDDDEPAKPVAAKAAEPSGDKARKRSSATTKKK